MAKQAFAEIQKSAQVSIGIIHVIDHDVFECDAAIRFLDIALQALLEFRQREATGFRHELETHVLSSRVKGNGKRELLRLFCKTVDSGNDAARGDANVTGSDAQALFVIDDAQRAQYVVVVQQRFALPHANDIGNAATHKALHCDNLVDDFPCGQIARKAFFPRCAKRARHWATSLRGEADRKAVSVTRRDSNGFDAYAIVVLQKQLMGAVAEMASSSTLGTKSGYSSES